MSLGRKIKNLRFNKNISKEYICGALNIPFSTLNRMEKDEIVPDRATIFKLAEILECEPEYLGIVRKKSNNQNNLNEYRPTGDLKLKLINLKNRFNNRIIYTEDYGKGIIINFFTSSEGGIYFKARFNNKKYDNEHTWIYPDAFKEGIVSFEDKWAEKPLKKQTYKDKEIIAEKKYLATVVDVCINNSQKDYKAKRVPDWQYNPYDEYFDPQEIADKQHTDYMKSYWRSISMNPYFASVQTKRDGLFRIGKVGVDELVVDWRDPRSSTYYNYTSLMANKSLGLTLVRDHIISYQKYKDFIDRFNALHSEEDNVGGFVLSSTSDKYLAQLLTYFRDQKKTHDIIQTIQANQYKIISNVDDKNVLVTGCAGSGKTMVLFHRIAYLAFNVKLFNPKRYCVISSNRLLSLEADELAKELNINQIENIDTTRFYYDNLKKIVEVYRSPYLLPHYNGEKTDKDVYEENYLNDLTESTYFNLNNKEDYCEYKNGKLVDAFEEIFKIKIPVDKRNVDFINNYFYQPKYVDFYPLRFLLYRIPLPLLNKTYKGYEGEMYELAKVLLKHFDSYLVEDMNETDVTSIEDLDKVMAELLSTVKNDEVIVSCINRKLKSYKTLIHLFDYDYFYKELSSYQSMLKAVPIPNLELRYEEKDRISDLNFMRRYMYKFMNKEGFYSQKKTLIIKDSELPMIKTLTNYIDQFTLPSSSLLANLDAKGSLVRLYDALYFKDHLDSFLEFKNGKPHKEMLSLFDYCIVEGDIDVRSSNDYIFLLLYLCNKNKLHPNKFLDRIFIDEFQNYSKEELKMLSELFSDADFCLFGDYAQKVEDKGVTSDSEIPFKELKKYSLDVNYRNAKEICDYINKIFKKNMLSAGVPGKVVIEKRGYKPNLINDQDRVAIIVKDISKLKMLNINQDEINIVDPQLGKIERDKLNILMVNDIKGLEFETVVVVVNDLTYNEKYLAFSRALNKLIVVNN